MNVKTNLILFAVLTALFLSGCKDFWHPEGSQKENGGGGTPNTSTGGVTATATSSSSIMVSWPPFSGATSSTYYYIYRSLSGASGSYSTLGDTYSTSYTDTGLSANTTYYYRIHVSDDNISGFIGTASAKTLSSGSGGGSNPFSGTWYGTWGEGGYGQPLILIFQESFYSWTLPDGGGWGFSGSYTYSGNFATLYGDMPGTAEIKGNYLILTNGYFGGNNQVICYK